MFLAQNVEALQSTDGWDFQRVFLLCFFTVVITGWSVTPEQVLLGLDSLNMKMGPGNSALGADLCGRYVDTGA